MATKLIQFRLSGSDLEALEAIAEHESLNLVAQRLIQDCLYTKLSTKTTTAMSTEIEAFVEQRLDNLEERIQEHIQALEKRLGETLA